MQKAVAVLLALLIVALIVLGLYAACGNNEGTLSCVRDIAIIILVLETSVATILLFLISWLFWQLTSTIRDEIMPILSSAKRTADTVQGTTTFVTDSLVAPLIRIAGFGSAIKGTVRALFGRK